MKKVLLSMVVLAGLAIGTTSCGDKKEAVKEVKKEVKKEVAKEVAKEVKKEVAKEVEAVAGNDAGKKLFAAKGCVACHSEDKKVVGPSIKEIAKVYADKKGNMVKFLKGNADAIVDPSQFAVMQANLAITKAMSSEDLQSIVAYMRSVK